MSSDPTLHDARMDAFGLWCWEDEDGQPRWPDWMRDRAVQRRQELRDAIDRVIATREAHELDAELREAADWRAGVERPEV